MQSLGYRRLQCFLGLGKILRLLQRHPQVEQSTRIQRLLSIAFLEKLGRTGVVPFEIARPPENRRQFGVVGQDFTCGRGQIVSFRALIRILQVEGGELLLRRGEVGKFP